MPRSPARPARAPPAPRRAVHESSHRMPSAASRPVTCAAARPSLPPSTRPPAVRRRSHQTSLHAVGYGVRSTNIYIHVHTEYGCCTDHPPPPAPRRRAQHLAAGPSSGGTGLMRPKLVMAGSALLLVQCLCAAPPAARHAREQRHSLVDGRGPSISLFIIPLQPRRLLGSATLKDAYFSCIQGTCWLDKYLCDSVRITK